MAHTNNKFSVLQVEEIPAHIPPPRRSLGTWDSQYSLPFLPVNAESERLVCTLNKGNRSGVFSAQAKDKDGRCSTIIFADHPDILRLLNKTGYNIISMEKIKSQ
jgi:hypothetical protein